MCLHRCLKQIFTVSYLIHFSLTSYCALQRENIFNHHLLVYYSNTEAKGSVPYICQVNFFSAEDSHHQLGSVQIGKLVMVFELVAPAFGSHGSPQILVEKVTLVS